MKQEEALGLHSLDTWEEGARLAQTHLPVLGHSVPDTDAPCVACGNELISNKEQGFHWHTQVEDTCRWQWGGAEECSVGVWNPTAGLGVEG